MKQLVTRVTRFLDERKIPYRVLPHAQAVYTVDAAARERGVPAREMVKCILLVDSGGRYVMACVTGDVRVDTRAVRKKLPGWKRLRFAGADEIARVTGYVQGAVAPVDLPDGVQVVFDPGIRQCTKVNISSGDPMAGLGLDPEDLIRVAQAAIWPIAEEH